MLKSVGLVRVTRDLTPQLIVVVDTEEEFDWFAPPNRDSNSVKAILEIERVQDIFDSYGIRPCYVMDYPIASQSEGIKALKPIFDDGRCELGAHLHPWVNPPVDEELCYSNMYPGNLPEDLERVKLEVLTDQITRSFGHRPKIYKAGRYGLGRKTAAILDKLEYSIDLSYCPAFDYSSDGGPNYSKCDSRPFWFGESRKMLEIPLTGAFVGVTGRYAASIYQAAGSFSYLRARGLLSRLRLVDRLMLSPEGYSHKEHKMLTKRLLDQGQRTFTWNFHSPSVLPGLTNYTRTESDMRSFLDSFRRYFDFFLEEVGGVVTTPSDLRALLEDKG